MPETFGDTDTLGGGAVGATGAETAAGRADGDVLTARDKFRKVSEEVRRGAEVARERYNDAAENLRLGYDKVRVQANDVGGQVNTFVRDNPGKAVLLAAAAGFLVGLVVRRGRDDEDAD